MTDPKPTYATGELVDITIRAARVRGYHGAPGTEQDLMVSYGGEDGRSDLNLALDVAGVTVERMAPAEWPPRYKQIWQDCNGDLWTLVRGVTIDGPQRPYTLHRLTCTDGSREAGIHGTADLLARYGPMTLVFDANPQPADTEDAES